MSKKVPSTGYVVNVSLSSILETQQRLTAKAVATNARMIMPLTRAMTTPMTIIAKTSIYYAPNPLMMLTGFNKSGEGG